MLSTSGLQSGTSIWSAFALSDDDQMGDDDVIACKILSDGTAVVERDYNINADNTYPVPLSTSDSAIGLSNSAVTYSNGMLTCSFTRVNSMSTVANYRNIANPAYVLFATGPVNSAGFLQYHSDRTASQTQINFPTGQQVQTTTVATSTTTVTKVPGNYSGSFTAPGYSLTWLDTATYTDFTFVGSSITATSTNIYIAMGLSSDDQMVIRILMKALIYISNFSFICFVKGDDDVVICKVSSGVASVERYYNIEEAGPNYISLTNPTLGLTNANIVYNSTGLVCSFRRAKATNGLSQVFDITNNYYILLAGGSVSFCNNFIYFYKPIAYVINLYSKYIFLIRQISIYKTSILCDSRL